MKKIVMIDTEIDPSGLHCSKFTHLVSKSLNSSFVLKADINNKYKMLLESRREGEWLWGVGSVRYCT